MKDFGKMLLSEVFVIMQGTSMKLLRLEGGWIIMFGKDGYRNALEVKAGTKMAVR